MKRIYLIAFTFISLLMVSSCDLLNNNFKSLDLNYIPNKVTKNFTLDSKYTWTSNNEEVLKIEDNYVTVIQQDEDVLVIITASIKDKSKDFDIVVLKRGSSLSPFEKALKFMEMHKEIYVIEEGAYINKKFDDLYLSFDDKQNEKHTNPTYFDVGETITIDHQYSKDRKLNVYFHEKIDEELVLIHSNTITIKYKEDKDLQFHLRPYSPYLDNDTNYLIIKSNEELDDYINTIEDIVDDIYLSYLNELKAINYYFEYKSLLLLNIKEPTSDNEVIFKNIKLSNNNIVIDVDTTYGIAEAIRNWQFVVEVNKKLTDIKDVIINRSYLEYKDLYLNAYTYQYSYIADSEKREVIIESVNDLEDYINTLDESIVHGQNYVDTIYKNHLLKYDEQYFINKKLILINYISGSGSVRYLYKGYELKGEKLIIHLDYKTPYIVTTDEVRWNFIFESDKQLEFAEVNLKVSSNIIDINPIIKKPLETIIFTNNSYDFDNVYKATGNLIDYQEHLENKYNIDFNKDVVVIEDKEAFKEIYSILKGEAYNKEEDLEGFVWLLINRVALGSQYININYNYYDQKIGYIYPNGDKPGLGILFDCIDIIKMSVDDYNSLYNLNFKDMN